MGDNLPTAEQLEMYNLTLPQYQEGITLITAQLAEKEKARLLREEAEQETEKKEVVSADEMEKGRIANANIMQEVAKLEALSVGKVADTTPKATRWATISMCLFMTYIYCRERKMRKTTTSKTAFSRPGPQKFCCRLQKKYSSICHLFESQKCVDY